MTVEQALVASDLGQIMVEARLTMERAAAEIQRLRTVNAECVEALAAAKEHLGAIYLREKREAFVRGLIADPPPALTKVVAAIIHAEASS